ncbi:MAG: hypothetical protein HOV68_03705 [Streptomycetaceae bacterium]|nr:hypothetical protein [Streptomycetaceae bacterium]
MSSSLALGVLIRVLLALPAKPDGRARWWRFRRSPRGFVWQADGGDAFVDVLEDAEGVVAASRVIGVMSREEYHEQMQRVARIDQERRPVRVPQTRGA